MSMKPDSKHERDAMSQLPGALGNLTFSGTYAPLAPQASFLLEYWTILKKRRWLVLSIVLVTTVVAGMLTAREKPMYAAVGRIAVNHESAINLGTKDPQFMLDQYDGGDYTVDLETQIKVLQSDATIFSVVRALHLDQSPEFGGAKSDVETTLRIDSARQTALLNGVRGGLSVASLPATRILEIRYASHNPQLAAQIVNQLMQGYIEQNLRARFEATSQTSDWLTKQLADLQMKVEVSQQKLIEYQKEHGVVGLGEKENVVTTKLEALNQALTTAEGKRMQAEAAYHVALSGNPELLDRPSQEKSSPLEALQSKEADLKTQLAALSSQFGPNYPKCKELSAQIAEIQKQKDAEQLRALARAKAEYEEALEHEKVLRQAFENQKQDATQLSQNEIDYSLLKQNAESYRTLYDGLLQRLKEAGVAAGIKSSNIQIVDQARVPTAPYAPNMHRSLTGGLLLGCFFGILTVFVLESLDNTVRTPEEAELVSSLSTLGVIPAYPHRVSNALIDVEAKDGAGNFERGHHEIYSTTKPRSEIAESYRALRTSILLSASGPSAKVILITSALPKDGKSSTAVNTAAVLAQAGAKVLLIDADLRRPSLHYMLRVQNVKGLSTWLAGRDADGPKVIATGIENVHILPTGPKPPYPAELLGSPAFRSMIGRFRDEYDYVVIDSPPVLSVTDAVLMSVVADAVLLVIRSRKTTKGALRRSLDMLHHANVHPMGIVLNAFNVKGEEYGYYRYYYGYGNTGEYYSDSESEKSEHVSPT